MIARALTLAFFDIRRLIRSRALKIAFFAVPLIFALPRVVLAKSVFIQHAAYVCPFICLIMVWGVLYNQRSVDAVSGLLAGLRSCPVPRHTLLLSRIFAAAIIIGVQMLLFRVVVAVKF